MTTTIPTPKTPLHERAFVLLRAIEQFDRSLAELVDLNGRRESNTRSAIQYLRDHKLIHICGHTPYAGEPIYRFGKGKDVRLPRAKKSDPAISRAPQPFRIPEPDPVTAALFGMRPAE
jgi:hypothetical protein